MNNGNTIKKQIDDLINKINKDKKELSELQRQYRETYEVEELKELYLNKFYKYKENCFSLPQNSEDYWDTYYYVQEVDYKGMHCSYFEKDSDGEIGFGKVIKNSNMMQNLTEITEEEYNKAYDVIFNEVVTFKIKS